MLILSRKADETLVFHVAGQTIVLTVVQLGRSQVRLGVEAPATVQILRGELAARERAAQAAQPEVPPALP